MKPKKSKCPICGSKMKDTDGNLMCGSCGYFISAGSSLSGAYTTGSSASGNTFSGSPAAGVSAPASGAPQQTRPNTYSYDEDHRAAPSRREASGGVPNSFSRWYLLIVVIIALSTLGVMLPGLAGMLRNKSAQSDVSLPDAPPLPDGADDILEEMKKELAEEAQNADQTMTVRYNLPESEMFRQFIGQVFGKDYSKVSADELEQIISLHLYDSDNYYQVIEYMLADGQSGKFFYNNISSIPTADLRCFPKLEVLNLERETLDSGDLKGLRKLWALHCGNSPLELKEIVDPAQLRELHLYMNVFSNSLFGIEAFTGLSHLSVDGNWYLTDIGALSSLRQLTSLEITNGDTIDSFQVLYDMPWLQKLTIDSQKLRDIGFISGMPGLTELTVQNSELKKLDALADCTDTLTKLNLSHNYQVSDYDIVSEMNHLTDLTLFISYSFDEPSRLPDFSNMPDLKSLSIGNYDSFGPLVNAVGLEELTISDVYTDDLSAIAGLTGLKRLNLIDMSLDPSALEPVMNLTGLEVIDMSDSFIWGNVDGLLKLPNLKELNLNDCTAGFDMANLETNESLKILNMNDMTLKALDNGQWDYGAGNENNISLAELTDMFGYYPGLEELYLSGAELEDISFAAGLQCLMSLDITDNYVTDLSPLSDLPALGAVMCASNPISNDGGLGSKVLTKN